MFSRLLYHYTSSLIFH